MDKTYARRLASKWVKTNALLASPTIAPHIPPTRLFTAANLHKMTVRHGTVVLKPVCGGGGIGVMKVTRKAGGYSCTYMYRTRTFDSFRGLCKAVHAARRGKKYLIQKGIDLASIGRRPVDYRVKYVKSNGTWTFRAVVGRVARPGLFVTNLCRGGSLVSASHGLRHSLASATVKVKKREMRDLTRTCTALLERCFPGIAELGYDYGIDRHGFVWILEVNTRPQ